MDEKLPESEVSCSPDEDCEPNWMEIQKAQTMIVTKAMKNLIMDMHCIPQIMSHKRRMTESGILMRVERGWEDIDKLGF